MKKIKIATSCSGVVFEAVRYRLRFCDIAFTSSVRMYQLTDTMNELQHLKVVLLPGAGCLSEESLQKICSGILEEDVEIEVFHRFSDVMDIDEVLSEEEREQGHEMARRFFEK